MNAMHRQLLLAGAFALSVAALPATAQDLPPAGANFQETIVSQLEAQGFSRITITRTFLGRIRIHATSRDLEREIIFNPRTGEILRDYWDEIDGEELGAAGATERHIVSPDRVDRGTTGAGNTTPNRTQSDGNDDRSERDSERGDDKSDNRDGGREDDRGEDD